MNTLPAPRTVTLTVEWLEAGRDAWVCYLGDEFIGLVDRPRPSGGDGWFVTTARPGRDTLDPVNFRGSSVDDARSQAVKHIESLLPKDEG